MFLRDSSYSNFQCSNQQTPFGLLWAAQEAGKALDSSIDLFVLMCMKLVKQRSACFDCHDQIPLDAPHVMMNKFSGPQDRSFRLVSGCLKKMFDKAPVINIRTAEERDCLQLLTSNYREDKDRKNERVVNTCKWFLEHPKFDSWRRDKTANLLWVSADPGCGKSVLSRALVDEGLLGIHGENPSICYFFFKDDDASRQNSASALCATLHQLFTQKPMLLKHVMLDYVNHGQKLHTMSMTLWEILLKAASDPQAGEIVCLFDALDECQELARDNLIRWMGNFFSTRDRNIARLKFLVTSRPYFEIEGTFTRVIDDISSISLRGEEESEKISEEINLVIDDRVTSICRKRKFAPKVRKVLIKHLQDMKQRTYLWLHFVLEVIRKTLDSTEARLKRLLETIPLTVDDAYEKILKRATDPQARTLLNIIVAAARPLNLQEINVALAIDERLGSGELCRSRGDLDLEPEERFRTKVRNICGLFVNIVDSKVYLIHQTAKEFLMGTRSTDQAVSPAYPGLGVWKHSLNQIRSNLILAKICLSYLHFDEFESDVTTSQGDERYDYGGGRYKSRENSFLVYAARNWVSHFRVAQNTVDQPLRHLALGICDPQTNRFPNWFKLYLLYTNCFVYNDLDHTSLTVTSFLGLQTLVKLLLEEHGVEVNFTGGEGRTSLTWAAEHGHVDVVQLLLQRGAKIDCEDMMGQTPLSWAAGNGKLDVVKMLLNEGAELDLVGETQRTPLGWAASSGHIDVVKLLLQSGADFHQVDSRQRTTLSLAASRGHLEIVKFLLEEGAELDSKDDERRTPLSHAASGYDTIDVAQLLLEKGAECDSRDNLGRTPLSWAAGGSNKDIFKLLVEKGAGCDSKDNEGRTPLSHAAGRFGRFGSFKIIQLLLEKGAELDSKDNVGQTPLSRAAKTGEVELVKELLEMVLSVTSETIGDEHRCLMLLLLLLRTGMGRNM